MLTISILNLILALCCIAFGAFANSERRTDAVSVVNRAYDASTITNIVLAKYKDNVNAPMSLIIAKRTACPVRTVVVTETPRPQIYTSTRVVTYTIPNTDKPQEVTLTSTTTVFPRKRRILRVREVDCSEEIEDSPTSSAALTATTATSTTSSSSSSCTETLSTSTTGLPPVTSLTSTSLETATLPISTSITSLLSPIPLSPVTSSPCTETTTTPPVQSPTSTTGGISTLSTSTSPTSSAEPTPLSSPIVPTPSSTTSSPPSTDTHPATTITPSTLTFTTVPYGELLSEMSVLDSSPCDELSKICISHSTTHNSVAITEFVTVFFRVSQCGGRVGAGWLHPYSCTSTLTVPSKKLQSSIGIQINTVFIRVSKCGGVVNDPQLTLTSCASTWTLT